MAEYIYQPIDLDGPAVRLIRLLRGNLTDDIQCELFEGLVNQSDGGIPYNALSYTWGSMGKAAKIAVNGSIMHVTSNLYTALQHLRFEDQDRILWIDAICIDQDNVREKRHQVQQMSLIYKEAEQVVIWLGQGNQESDLVMDFMKRLQENNVNVGGDWRPLAKHQARLQLIDKHQNANLCQGIGSILERPWFWRIWILQEIANARAAIVLCGSKSVSARIFAQFPSLIGLQPHPHCQAVLDIMPGLSREESWWGQKRDLHTLLVKFHKSEATDKRDVIYALLGISSDAYRSNILFPDYEKELQQVIRDTTLFLLSHTNQDASIFEFLDWTLPVFLQNLGSLSSAVLRSASENGQEEIVKLFLAMDGVEADSKDYDGWTPLQRAAQNGHAAVVKLLLEKGAELESKDKWYSYKRTALSCAAENGHAAVVKLLLEEGAELELKDNKWRTPLSWAAENGHAAVVKLLLEKGAELKLKDYEGWTPLLWAARNGHAAVIKLLLEKGAELESDDYEKRTPLLWAAENGHAAAVKLLLEEGAELESKDYEERTPLLWAAENGHAAVVKLLLDKGAELESKDKWYKRTPLLCAAENGHAAVVELLLERDAELESKDDKSRTPLWSAARSGHAAVVELLLDKGAKLESKDKWEGQTPLSCATKNEHKTVIQLLLKKGAKV
jgi:ankyrin repeat protein